MFEEEEQACGASAERGGKNAPNGLCSSGCCFRACLKLLLSNGGGHGKTNSAIRPVEGSGQPGGCRKPENLAPAWLQLLGWASACLWLSWSGHDQLLQSPGGGEGGGTSQRRERSISSQQPSGVTFSNCSARGSRNRGCLKACLST